MDLSVLPTVQTPGEAYSQKPAGGSGQKTRQFDDHSSRITTYLHLHEICLL